MVYEEKGDFVKAIEDYRTAIGLAPRLVQIPFNLATLLEKIGRPCEAIFPVEQFLHYNPELRQEADVQARLASLYGAAACKDTRGEGRATIRFAPGAASIQSRAKLNGNMEATLVVDTGASLVTLSRRLASKLGLTEKPGSPIMTQTAGGIQSALLTTLDRLEIQGARSSLVDVAIIDTLPDNVDGLLGLSFLSRFDLTFDSKKGTLTLSQRKPEPGRGRVGAAR